MRVNEGEQNQPNMLMWRAAALIWMALIFTLSSAWFAPKMSYDSTLNFFGAINYFVRKCAHAGEFGVLTWLLLRSLYPKPFTLDRARWVAVLIALLDAVSDEYHQSFVPLRSGKATDVLFDAVGILTLAYIVGRFDRTPGAVRRFLLGPRSEPHGR